MFQEVAQRQNWKEKPTPNERVGNPVGTLLVEHIHGSDDDDQIDSVLYERFAAGVETNFAPRL